MPSKAMNRTSVSRSSPGARVRARPGGDDLVEPRRMRRPGFERDRIQPTPAAVDAPQPGDREDTLGSNDIAKPDRLAGSVTASQPADSSSTNDQLPRRRIGRAGHRQVDRAAGRREMRPREARPRRDAEIRRGPRGTCRVRPGTWIRAPGRIGEARVDPPHERHRLVADVGQPVGGSDERLAGPELHPALDPERRDDPGAAELDRDRRPGPRRRSGWTRPATRTRRGTAAARRRPSPDDRSGRPRRSHRSTSRRRWHRRRAAGRRTAGGDRAGRDRPPSR